MGNPSWGDGYTLSGLLGDINFDETLNIYDAVMLVAIMLGFEDGANLQLHACDTNQDGIIDILDRSKNFDVILFQENWIFSDKEIARGLTHHNIVTLKRSKFRCPIRALMKSNKSDSNPK